MFHICSYHNFNFIFYIFRAINFFIQALICIIMMLIIFVVSRSSIKIIKFQMVNRVFPVGILFAKDVVLRLEDESFSNISTRLGEV